MLQRKQTLFLLIASFLLIGAVVSPLYTGTSDNSTILVKAFGSKIDLNGEFKSLNTLYVGINFIVEIALTLLIIFLYAKRPLQMRLCLLNVFFVLVNAGALFTLVSGEIKNILQISSFDINTQPGLYLMLASVPFFLIAYNFIKKDEDLVKSVDRIR